MEFLQPYNPVYYLNAFYPKCTFKKKMRAELHLHEQQLRLILEGRLSRCRTVFLSCLELSCSADPAQLAGVLGSSGLAALRLPGPRSFSLPRVHLSAPSPREPGVSGHSASEMVLVCCVDFSSGSGEWRPGRHVELAAFLFFLIAFGISSQETRPLFSLRGVWLRTQRPGSYFTRCSLVVTSASTSSVAIPGPRVKLEPLCQWFLLVRPSLLAACGKKFPRNCIFLVIQTRSLQATVAVCGYGAARNPQPCADHRAGARPALCVTAACLFLPLSSLWFVFMFWY